MFDKMKTRIDAKITEPITRVGAIATGALVLSILALMFAMAAFGGARNAV